MIGVGFSTSARPCSPFPGVNIRDSPSPFTRCPGLDIGPLIEHEDAHEVLRVVREGIRLLGCAGVGGFFSNGFALRERCRI